ncbi:MAG: sugar transferase [Candidatus Krumholzibacteriia bacterium]
MDALSINPEPEQDQYVVIRPRGRAGDVFTEREVFCLVAAAESAARRPWRVTFGRACWRLFEIVVSTLALAVSLPAIVIVAIVVRVDSPGPPLFFQRRVAKSKLMSGEDLLESDEYEIVGPRVSPDRMYWVPQAFWFVKHRSMYADARERFADLYDYNLTSDQVAKFQFKVPDDPRVTRVGRWLRESTLDELPNFWNVIRGDMSLVGPRPELPQMIANYRHEQMSKFTVKPGITGLPQISGRGRLAFQETVAYDVEYVARKSLALDVKILFATLWKVVTRHGAF